MLTVDYYRIDDGPKKGDVGYCPVPAIENATKSRRSSWTWVHGWGTSVCGGCGRSLYPMEIYRGHAAVHVL